MNPNQIQKLGEKNYESWKIQIRSLLVYNELWQYTNGTEVKTEGNERDWLKKDEKALALILLSVEENQLNHVKRAETSNEAWQNLQRVHQSKGPVRRAALYRELIRIKKDAHQTMTQYTNSFQNKLEQLEEAGVNIPDELASIMLLGSLPTDYENFAIAIETRDVLPNLESLKVKLIEEEARKRENHDDEMEDLQNNAFMTQKKYPPRFKDIRLHGRASSGTYNDGENAIATKGRKNIDNEVRPRRIDNTAQSMSSRGTSPNFLAQSRAAICIILLSALS